MLTVIKSRQTGFSLVELLIAMTLGLLLTLGMFSFFSGNQRTAALNGATANMQENVRYALNALSDDIRMAGYQGCADLNSGSVDIIANIPPSADLQSTVISGSVVQDDQTWSPQPQLGTGSDAFQPPTSVTPRAGTHTIAMQYAKNPGSSLNGAQSDGGVPSALGPLVLSRTIDVDVGELALVSNCEAGEIFRVSGMSVNNDGTMSLSHAASHNTRGTFQRIYGMPSTLLQTRVMPFTTRVYFVADSGEDKLDGTPVYALYQQTMPFNDDSNPPVMLIEGVENMRILFGIGAANGQLQYVTAVDSVYDPTQIRSVRIGLLMASHSPLLDSSDTKSYMLTDTAIEVSGSGSSASTYPDDKRMRLAFNTTVSVRNRRAQN